LVAASVALPKTLSASTEPRNQKPKYTYYSVELYIINKHELCIIPALNYVNDIFNKREREFEGYWV